MSYGNFLKLHVAIQQIQLEMKKTTGGDNFTCCIMFYSYMVEQCLIFTVVIVEK